MIRIYLRERIEWKVDCGEIYALIPIVSSELWSGCSWNIDLPVLCRTQLHQHTTDNFMWIALSIAVPTPASFLYLKSH